MLNIAQYLNQNHSDVGINPFSNHPGGINSQINIDQSVSNLFSVVDVLNELDIKYTLVFGTLLGIYRDGNLISWDTDTDLGIWEEDSEQLIKMTQRLEEKKFSVTRFKFTKRKRGTEPSFVNILTFTRGGDYIDLYCYRRHRKKEHLNCGLKGAGHLYPKDFQPSNTISFKGRDLVCVDDVEKYFEYLYGDDWRTPIRNKPADIRYNNK